MIQGVNRNWSATELGRVCQEWLRFRGEHGVLENQKAGYDWISESWGSGEKQGWAVGIGLHASITINHRVHTPTESPCARSHFELTPMALRTHLFISVFSYRRGNWGIERLGNILSIVAFVSVRTRIPKSLAPKTVLLPVIGPHSRVKSDRNHWMALSRGAAGYNVF